MKNDLANEVKCPYCGFVWLSFNDEKELIGSERECENCSKLYDIHNHCSNSCLNIKGINSEESI